MTQSRWLPQPTLEQASEMFDLAISALDLDVRTPKGRVRRVGEIAWSTVAREMRETEATRATREAKRLEKREARRLAAI